MKKKKICLILTGLFFLNYQTDAALKIPPGFEELAKGQVLLLEVSLYGESLGFYKANVDLEKVRFLENEKLIRAITDRYGKAQELNSVLINAFSKPFARNSQLSCGTDGGHVGCGYINTKNVAIIYNESNNIVNLFLASEFVPKSKNKEIYFRNAPESHNGFIHQQNINFVADQESQSLSIQGNGTLGLTKNGYANIDWNYTGQTYNSQSNSLIQINNAYVRQDLWKKVYLQGGQMDTRDIFSNSGGDINLDQLPIGKIRGVRIGSTIAWVNRNKVSRGTPINVFLTRDSRIDAFRDNRLLQTFYVSAGAQQLDTSAFPAGSYIVTLKFYEDNRFVRTQTVPYSNLSASKKNNFQWFMQAGSIADDDDHRNTNDSGKIVTGGIRIPITQSLALTAGATVLENVHYEQGALDWSHGFDHGPLLDGVLRSRASYMHGSDGTAGNSQEISYNDGFSLSFYRSATTSSDCSSQTEKRYANRGCNESSSIMFSVPVKGWSTTLGYTTTKSDGRYVYRSELPDENREHHSGAPWEHVYTTHSRSRAWQADLSRSFLWNDLSITTSIGAFVRHDNSYQQDDKGGYVKVSLFRTKRPTPDDHGSSSSSLSSSWRTSRRSGDEFGYSGSYTRYMDDIGKNQLGASINGLNTDTVNAGVSGQYAGQYGDGSLNISNAWSKYSSGNTLSTSGSYSSSFAIDRDGFFWGRWGDGMPAAAVTFGVDSGDNDNSSTVNVSVDNSGQEDVRGNSRALFTVPGYKQSTLAVKESTDVSQNMSSEVSKGLGSRSFFMTPGKVFNRKVSIKSRYTWLGRLTDDINHPMDDVIPLNVLSWSPLGSGGFSLETEHKIKALYLMRGDEFMQCPMQVRSINDVVRWVGTIKCDNIAMTRLPESEKKQAELMTANRINNHNDTTAMNSE